MVFWVAVILTSFNVVWSIINFYKIGDFFHLIVAIEYFVGLGPLFALLRWRFKRAIRYLPCFVFFYMSVFLIVAAKGYSPSLASGITDEDVYINLLAPFLICAVILTQSDFRVALFILCPTYIVAAIFSC
jgi:hypothetical protein